MKPTTAWGAKLLEHSWWDAGMRGHFTRLSNTTGPEDMAYAIVRVEEEAFKDGIDRAAERVLSRTRPEDTLADILAHIRGEQP